MLEIESLLPRNTLLAKEWINSLKVNLTVAESLTLNILLNKKEEQQKPLNTHV